MPRFSKSEIKEHKNWTEERLKQYQGLGYDILKARGFLFQCAPKVFPEIIELGTGNGHLAVILAQAGHNLTSLDRDLERQKNALMLAEAYGLLDKINFIYGDAEKLDFPDNSFSTVICADLWHHLSKHEKALDEMLRIWNGKGSLVIADMDRKALDIVAGLHASEGGFHDEGTLSIEKAGDLLKQRGVRFKRSVGDGQIVFVVEEKCR